jgi:twitching motility protein PilT
MTNPVPPNPGPRPGADRPGIPPSPAGAPGGPDAAPGGGGPPKGSGETNMHDLLQEMITRKASDLHLTAGVPPMFRVDGQLMASTYRVLKPETCEKLAYSVLTEEQRKRFEMKRELDVSFGIPGLSRFRANIFLQRGVVSMAIRQIPYNVQTVAQLGLQKTIVDFASKPKGLVLVTGPTGSGKSTTLAALINLINEERHGHIMTIEDPIEFVHQHKSCIVNQREVNADTESFANALKYVLRQDPDVIMLGEMRDLETIAAALTIAETGHLVFATLHTNSTFEAVNRMVDVFPPSQQQQVLSQLAFVLEGVVAQQLLPRARGGGRVLIPEILVCTPAIKAVIREGKTHQIYTLMQAGAKFGMQTMNQALFSAYANRLISYEEAIGRSFDPQEFAQMASKSGLRAA